MQKKYLVLFCMLLSIQTHPQLATPIASEQNYQNFVPQFQPARVDQSIIHPAHINQQALFEIPQLITAPSHDQSLDLFSYFLRPINFSKEGITHYFKYTYNHDQYTQYLPYNFSHMIQFLEFGQAHDQNQAYAKSILKLFLQKIKGCDFINSYSLISSMPKIADALTPYMIKQEASFLKELQQSLKHRFSNIFSTYMSYFQKNPDAFLDALAEQIAKKTNEVQTLQHVEVEHVKKDILRFLETCIGKLVWSPQDAYDAWISINELATQVENFLDKQLLCDVDAMDDLCWSLIHRFCYFLEIAADDISQETFIQIIKDIHQEKLVLFQIEEQEDLVTDKKNYLLKKIKNYCPYEYASARKKCKFYAAQTVIDAAPEELELP